MTDKFRETMAAHRRAMYGSMSDQLGLDLLDLPADSSMPFMLVERVPYMTSFAGCFRCGSVHGVEQQAYVYFDPDHNEWEVTEMCDGADPYCSTCTDQTMIVEVSFAGWDEWVRRLARVLPEAQPTVLFGLDLLPKLFGSEEWAQETEHPALEKSSRDDIEVNLGYLLKHFTDEQLFGQVVRQPVTGQILFATDEKVSWHVMRAKSKPWLIGGRHDVHV